MDRLIAPADAVKIDKDGWWTRKTVVQCVLDGDTNFTGPYWEDKQDDFIYSFHSNDPNFQYYRCAC